MGIVALAQGDVARAVTALDRALALKPDDTLALRERGSIDLRQGHPTDALRRLDRAVAADPFDPELRYHRSLALARLGRLDQAAADTRRSEQLRREHDEMAEISSQLIDHPAHDGLRCRAARWMLDHGRADEAAQWARLVLRDHPDHPQANHVLADYHQRRGEVGLANFYRLYAAPVPARGSGQPGTDHDRGSSPPFNPVSGR
jgi:tetratricopeptide (TPR) repeat protein